MLVSRRIESVLSRSEENAQSKAMAEECDLIEVNRSYQHEHNRNGGRAEDSAQETGLTLLWFRELNLLDLLTSSGGFTEAFVSASLLPPRCRSTPDPRVVALFMARPSS